MPDGVFWEQLKDDWKDNQEKTTRLHQWAFGNGTGKGAEGRLFVIEQKIDHKSCLVGLELQEYKLAKENQVQAIQDFRRFLIPLLVTSFLSTTGIIVTIILALTKLT